MSVPPERVERILNCLGSRRGGALPECFCEALRELSDDELFRICTKLRESFAGHAVVSPPDLRRCSR